MTIKSIQDNGSDNLFSVHPDNMKDQINYLYKSTNLENSESPRSLEPIY